MTVAGCPRFAPAVFCRVDCVAVVCFDLGGVLVRICRTWEEGCARAGIDVRDPAWLSSETARAARSEVVATYQRGEMSSAEYFAAMSRALGGLYDAGEVSRIHDAWLIEDYPGAASLVEELNAVRGVVTACLSNTNAAHWPRLVERGKRREFAASSALSRHFASHLLGVAKPDRGSFEAVERALGVPARRVVLFDDLGENVTAARRAGWAARCIDASGDTVAEMRHWLIDNGVLPSHELGGRGARCGSQGMSSIEGTVATKEIAKYQA